VGALRGCPSRPPPMARCDVFTNCKVRPHDERDAKNPGHCDELSMTVGRQHRPEADANRSSKFLPVFTMP
jgi:hypothetical protein